MKTFAETMLFPMFVIDLTMFDGNTNVTTDAALSGEMKTFWSKYLIEMAEPYLPHSQFAQKHPIPQHGGKTIEFRKWAQLGKQLEPLTEGVTPDGQKLSMSTLTATVSQYGGYVQTSDVLNLTAIDDTMRQAVEQVAQQAARTVDTLDREVLCAGTNVLYAGGKSDRSALTSTDKLTVDAIKKAVRQLKIMNTPKINGDYVAIIHPDLTYDLTNDNDWKYPHQYVDTANIYSGEIGKIAGVRFVESTEAKKFVAPNLVPVDGETAGARTMTVSSYSSKVVTVSDQLTTNQAKALKGRKVIIDGEIHEITAATAYDGSTSPATAATFTIKDTPTEAPAASDVVYPGEAGAEGRDVYATLILGANAYGTTEISGGGMEFIAKQLGSAGTADPLNQRATAGWKCIRVTKILIQEYMCRVESCSTYNDHDSN